ncbi:MAG: binding-protein-dependent transport system inner rane component [Pseudonocardiales bacterium]|nr:binding-protein-dependent transport system inner rane component [Pseudonocardiales bacterium]
MTDLSLTQVGLGLDRDEPTPPTDAALRGPSRGRDLLRLLAQPGLVLAVIVAVLVLLAAFFPSVFTGRDPLEAVPKDKLQGPSLEHLFGTDQLGRDLFSRVVHGAALSMKATVIAVSLGLVLGSLIGLISGFFGGWLDFALMRVVEVVLAIPSLLLSLAIITALGFGTVNVAIAVGLASVARFARVMRSEVLRVRGAVFVEAAKAAGARWYEILFRHVLPSALGPATVLAALDFGIAILAVSALSFLGYGANAPAPEWGSLVAGGRTYITSAWWLTVLPGVVVMAAVLATNRISRAVDGGRSRS